MKKPESNGLFEVHEEGKKRNSGDFCCFQLGIYMVEEGAQMDTSEYMEFRKVRLDQAKAGNCAYRHACPVYKTSKLKINIKTLNT